MGIQISQVDSQVEEPPAMTTTPRFGIDSITKEKHHLDNVFDDLDELMDFNVQFFPLPETTTCNESKIESHRQATAKRKRTNGRFKTCQVEWVNVTLTGEFEKNVVPTPEL